MKRLDFAPDQIIEASTYETALQHESQQPEVFGTSFLMIASANFKQLSPKKTRNFSVICFLAEGGGTRLCMGATAGTTKTPVSPQPHENATTVTHFG